eukprot:1675312-Rhodomonas_salina.4
MIRERRSAGTMREGFIANPAYVKSEAVSELITSQQSWLVPEVTPTLMHTAKESERKRFKEELRKNSETSLRHEQGSGWDAVTQQTSKPFALNSWASMQLKKLGKTHGKWAVDAAGTLTSNGDAQNPVRRDTCAMGMYCCFG